MANDSTGQDKTGQDNSIVSSKEDIYISDADKKKYSKEHWFSWKAAGLIIQKKAKFTELVKPYVEKYGSELCNDFWKYWTEPHKNKTGQLRWEGERYFDFPNRLGTFKKNEKNDAKH